MVPRGSTIEGRKSSTMSEQPTNRIVWAEIPVADMDRAKAFYSAVLQAPLTDQDGGPNPMAWLPYAGGEGVAGHIYPGEPATKGAGPTVHLAVTGNLKDAMGRVKQAGGEVVSDVIEIPAGKFFYAVDPDGNSIGIFEG